MLKKNERQRPHLIIQDLSNPTDREVCNCKGNIQCRAKKRTVQFRIEPYRERNEQYRSQIEPYPSKKTKRAVQKTNMTVQKE